MRKLKEKTPPKKLAKGGVITNQGYLPDSPDRFNSYNIIPNSKITMNKVPFDILGTDNKGNQKLMHPGMDYTFPGDYVHEVPMKKTGGMSRDKADHILAYQNYFTENQIKRANKYRLDSVDKHVSVAQFGGGSDALMRDSDGGEDYDYKEGGSLIKPSHKGRFTAYKKRTGKTTQEALHSKDPHVREMAQFAWNFRSKKQTGGEPDIPIELDVPDPGKFAPKALTPEEMNARRALQDSQTTEDNSAQLRGPNPVSWQKKAYDASQNIDKIANVGDQINQGIKDRYNNQYLRDRTVADNNFAVTKGDNTGNRGDYSTTGSSYGQFRPNELGAKSPYGTTGKFYQTGGGYIPDQIQDTGSFNPSQAGPNVLGEQSYNMPQVGPSSGTPPPITPEKEVDLNQSSKFAYKYYTEQKGLPGHIAAGIVGNLYQESGLKPGAVEQGNTGNGRGIAQWDVRDRWQGYLQWAKDNERNPYDLKSQLDYVLVEPGQSKQALDKLKNTTTPEQAALIFGKIYERPSEKYANWGTREGVASKLYNNQYKEGGTYEVSPDQLFHILQNGGQLEFI